MSTSSSSSSGDVLSCGYCGENHDETECLLKECTRCNGTGHFARICKSPPGDICFICSAPGHLATSCPNPKPGPGVTCGICGGYGHGGHGNTAADCASQSRTPRCDLCSSSNDDVHHYPRDCPQQRAAYADWKGYNACQQCGVVGHYLPDCPDM